MVRTWHNLICIESVKLLKARKLILTDEKHDHTYEMTVYFRI